MPVRLCANALDLSVCILLTFFFLFVCYSFNLCAAFTYRIDNTIAHGPGFRDQDADPCFAKVVRGFETLKRIQSIPCRDDDTILMDFVGIKAITILEDFDFDDYLGTELPPLLDLDKFKNASSIDRTRDPIIVER